MGFKKSIFTWFFVYYPPRKMVTSWVAQNILTCCIS